MSLIKKHDLKVCVLEVIALKLKNVLLIVKEKNCPQWTQCISYQNVAVFSVF